ncbi:hypothetical protein HDU96_002149 [Phlyctochytrium bullatum]|nr:hypothetical protein HDU96_002149 [Phlyctochytrium bullatum]
MFRPTPQTTIQFILERSTLDIPPPGWSATSSVRHLTGILRLTIPPKAAPLRADRISVDLYGTMNGVRDSKRTLSNTSATAVGAAGQTAAVLAAPALGMGAAGVVMGEGMVDMTFMVWQPRDDAEMEAGLSAGIR